MSKPHLITIGAQKAATTWLQHVFDTNAQFWVPPGSGEIHFFDRDFGKGAAYYRDLYAAAPPGKVTCDVSPDYLDCTQAPQRMKIVPQLLGRSLRFVLICREPVSRLLSAYQMRLRQGHTYRGLKEAVDREPGLLSKGCYSKHLENYLAHFDKEQFLFILLDDIKDDKEGVFERIAQFAGVEGALSDLYQGKRINPGGMQRYPFIDHLYKMGGLMLRRMGWTVFLHKMKASVVASKVRQFNRTPYQLSEEDKAMLEDLKDYYRGDIEALAELIERPDLLDRWGYA